MSDLSTEEYREEARKRLAELVIVCRFRNNRYRDGFLPKTTRALLSHLLGQLQRGTLSDFEIPYVECLAALEVAWRKDTLGSFDIRRCALPYVQDLLRIG